MVASKKCSKCKMEKPFLDFYKNKKGKFGLQSWCKKCHQEDTKRYKEINRDRLLQASSEWRRNNKEKCKEYVYRRRARIKNVPNEKIDYQIILDRDGFWCYLCNSAIDQTAKYPNLECYSFDHVIPISKGGSHTYDNIKISHFRCNNLKGNR